MTKTLVLAEKPSVMKDIVNAMTPVFGKFTQHDDHFENDNYIITSAIGHLVTIKCPEEYEVKRGKWSFANLPVIPPTFELVAVDKTKSRLNAVVKLMKRKDVSILVNACDAGREGELIFRLIEQYAGNGKSLGKTIQRLWLQSMTPQAIRDGFQKLLSEQQMQGLNDAAHCRSEADWIVGINGTRAMTAFNSREGGFFLTTVGRVQTPTLSLMVEREDKIRKHVPKDYWEVHAMFQGSKGSYPGKWYDPKFKKPKDEDLTAVTTDAATSDLRSDRIWEKPTAEQVARETAGKPVQVSEESKPSTSSSPGLFDLTSLQREANSKLGLSAKTTLSVAQALYEKHKVLTYPRTDSRYLPNDYLPVAIKTFQSIAESNQSHLSPHARYALEREFVKMTKKVFDGSKITDHFAIIPTGMTPRGLSDLEQRVYDMVTRRFMAVFFPPAEFNITTRISKVGEHHFKTEGKVLVVPGWLAVYGRDAQAEDNTAGAAVQMPPLVPGEQVKALHADMKDLQTKSQPRYNEGTLLGAMEGAAKQMDGELKEAMDGKGLGTPATRAAIIEGLINETYISREGKEMVPTPKAFQLMTLLKGLGVKELTSADLTGDWEHKLSMVEKGQYTRNQFMDDIAKMTRHMVECAKAYDRDTVPGDYVTLSTPCPNCGGTVSEHYRAYTCSCGFYVSKTPASRIFHPSEVEALIRDKRVGPLDGFKSKAGFPFKSEVLLKFDTEKKSWKMEFDFGEKTEEQKQAMDLTGKTPLGKCPKCAKGDVYEAGKIYICEHAIENGTKAACDFKSGRTMLQQEISQEQMKKLLKDGKTDLFEGFVSNRTNRPFKAFLVWDKGGGRVNFEFPPRDPNKPAGKFGGKPFNKFGGKHQHKGPKLGSGGKPSGGKPPRSGGEDMGTSKAW